MIPRSLLVAGFVAIASFAHAGTPLICHPFSIGNAKTLPGSADGFKGTSSTYDRKNLVQDTIALLTPQTPVIVRMETLRRAAIYATSDKLQGDRLTADDQASVSSLLEALRVRAGMPSADALALFDLGYFAETLRHRSVKHDLNGYELITRAAALRGNDPEMEFALALASSWPHRRTEHEQHLARARAGANKNALLAVNLTSHFSRS